MVPANEFVEFYTACQAKFINTKIKDDVEYDYQRMRASLREKVEEKIEAAHKKEFKAKEYDNTANAMFNLRDSIEKNAEPTIKKFRIFT